MGLKSNELSDSVPIFSFLGPWHANLIHIDRRKCVLFVNDKTLFNFIAPDIARAEIRDLDIQFNRYFSSALSSEGIANSVKDKILEEYRKIAYSGSNNKSVLGSMNDLAFHYKHHILSEGGIYYANVSRIVHELNHMPMGAIDYNYSIDALMKLYGHAT